MVLYSLFINIVLANLVWPSPNSWICILLICLIIHGMCMVSNCAPLHLALRIYFCIGKESGLLLWQQDKVGEDSKAFWERKGLNNCRRLKLQVFFTFSLGLQGSVSFLIPDCFWRKAETKAILFSYNGQSIISHLLALRRPLKFCFFIEK